MTTASILARATAEGLTLIADEGTLRVRGARRPSPDLLNELRRHKQELLQLLASRVAAADQSDLLPPFDAPTSGRRPPAPFVSPPRERETARLIGAKNLQADARCSALPWPQRPPLHGALDIS